MKNNVTGLKCVNCGKIWAVSQIKYDCPDCCGNLDFTYNYGNIKKTFTRQYLKNRETEDIRKYIPILPVALPGSFPPLLVGNTPLLRCRAIEKKLRIREFYIKDETRHPSLSFKDRASAVFLASAVEKKKLKIAAASTGNAGSSLACLSASMGIKPVVLVPKKAPIGKILQLIMFGAKVYAVDGTYDDAYELCRTISDKYGYYSRSTGYNPYTREGKKTVSFEISEQLAYQSPDYVFVSVGDGNIISGVAKGFREYFKLGLIKKMPKVIGVQSGKSNSIYLSWKNFIRTGELKTYLIRAMTAADSISVDRPSDWQAAVLGVCGSNGFFIEVSDNEILTALKTLPAMTGVFAEPAAACAYAGFEKAVKNNIIGRNSRVVCLITGNGLKDAKTALGQTEFPKVIKKTDYKIFSK